jgi:hypothetical protein
MEYLGWTITNSAKIKNQKDSRVYANNKRGEGFTAVSIDAAMRLIKIKENLVSDCCGAQEQSTNEGEPLFDRDTNICGDCLEECFFVPEADYY